MGYYASVDEADFTIPAENLEKAHKAMCDLNRRHDLKSGGKSPTGDPYEDKWFSWMPPRYHETLLSAAAILNELGFDVELENNGDISILAYDNKVGDEDIFLRAIAPFANEDSYLVWRGEDGSIWRNEVVNGELVTLHANITWE
jgi:hypothetical protein